MPELQTPILQTSEARPGRGLSSAQVLLAMAFVNALWAAKNFFVKVAMDGMSATTVGVVRWGGFALLLWGLMALPGFRRLVDARLPDQKGAWSAFLIGLLLFAPAHTLYYVALTYTTTIEGTVLHTSMPMITALFAWALLRERVSRARWLAIVVSCAGAYIVTAGFGQVRLSSSGTFGNVLYLSAIVVETLGVVLVARVILRSSGIGALAWQLIGMTVGMALISAVLPAPNGWAVAAITWPVVGAMAYLIVFASAICFCVWYSLVKRAPLSLLMVATGLQPIIATALGCTYLHEKAGTAFGVGAALVLAALGIAACERPEPAEAGG